MRSFVHARRGLSTVVTGAIMLTAVAVIGTSLVAWSNSNLQTFETGLANTASTNTNKINENLQIENVYFYVNKPNRAAKGGVNATLTNTGTIGLTVTDIKLVDSSHSDDFPQNVVILPGKSYSAKYLVTWGLQHSWSSQVPITITVTTARGLIFTTQVVPP